MEPNRYFGTFLLNTKILSSKYGFTSSKIVVVNVYDNSFVGAFK